MENRKKHRDVLLALFILYILATLALLFLRTPRGGGGWNLTPFETIRGYFRILSDRNPWADALRRYAWMNFIGNIVLFVPLGLFLPLLWGRQRRFPLFLLTVTASIIIVETAQHLTALGSLDVDDLILNLLGAAIGFLLWRLGAAFCAKKIH